MSALNVNKAIAIIGQQKDSAQSACSFRHDGNQRGEATRSPSLAPKPQTQSDGKILWSGSLSEAVVLLERDIKDCAETVSVEVARIRHVMIGILPYGRIASQKRDAYSAKFACSGTKSLTVSLTKSRKRMVEKVLLLC